MELHPAVARDWDLEGNGGIHPDQVAVMSNLRAAWRCHRCGRQSESSVAGKVQRHVRGAGPGCRSCAKQQRDQPTAGQSLADLRPDLAAEFDEERNAPTKATDLTPGSSRQMFWRCPVDKGHPSYCASVVNRRKSGCPACAGRVVTNTNSLLVVAPVIAAQWHPDKNGDLQPDHVVAGANKRVWWQCSRGHTWQAYIGTRVGQKTGCPVCCRGHRSAIEVALFAELHELLTPLLGPRSVRHHARPEGVPQRVTVSDILVTSPSLKVVVEYDGGYWHQPRTEPDRRKSTAIRAAGHGLIRVREDPLEALHSDDVTVHVSSEITVITTAVVRRMIERGWLPPAASRILDQYAVRQVRVGALLAEEMLADVAYRDLEEESLAVTHPELVAEWDDAANAPLRPRHVNARMSAPVAWICPLGDAYTAAPRERAAGRGCSVCAGKQVNSRTSLASCRPDLAKEYAASNEKPASKIGIGSHHAVTWVCQVCTHSWKTAVRNRIRAGSGCPACAGKVATAEVNLSVVYPHIAELWHPTLNGALTPQAVRPKSNKAVWWLCRICLTGYRRPIVGQVATKHLCCATCAIPLRGATRRAGTLHRTG